MLEKIFSFFDTYGFMPHGVCLRWKPAVFWSIAVSNAFIALAYFIIPIWLIYFISQKKNIEFRWIFMLYGLFILSCGVSHIIDIVVLWQPIYGVEAVVLIVTAIVSMLTAMVIWPQLPYLLKIPSPWELKEKNQALTNANKKLSTSESINRIILDNMPDAMLILAMDRTLVMASKQAHQQFDIAQDQPDRQHVDNLFTEKSRPIFIKLCHQLSHPRSTRHTNRAAEIQCIDHTGAAFPALIRIKPIQINEQDHILASIQNISQIKAYEQVLSKAEQINQLNQELKRSNEALNEFNYVASHDLKEPLRGIHHYAQFLYEDYADILNEEGIHMLKSLINQTNHLNSLIEHLLAYSRVGQTELKIEKIDINQCVDNVLETLAPLIQKENVDIVFKRNLPIIDCDQLRVEQIFLNLLTNGIKYNESQPKILEIDYNEAAQHFIVKDNGIGIEADFQQDIFIIFKRLHGKEAFGGGVGAGLTIIKKIIEKHHGNIWVESQPGKGTTFYFTLGINHGEHESDSNT